MWRVITENGRGRTRTCDLGIMTRTQGVPSLSAGRVKSSSVTGIASVNRGRVAGAPFTPLCCPVCCPLSSGCAGCPKPASAIRAGADSGGEGTRLESCNGQGRWVSVHGSSGGSGCAVHRGLSRLPRWRSRRWGWKRVLACAGGGPVTLLIPIHAVRNRRMCGGMRPRCAVHRP